MSSFTLILNSTNAVGTGNNTFQYQFNKGAFTIPEGSEMMITNIQIPYAFFNITKAYNNNTFSFSFPTGSSTYNTYTITIPDGFYTTTTLNTFLQQFMISKGLYLVDANGNNVYYAQILYNTTYYANTIYTFLVPTALPTGYNYPAGYTSATIFDGAGFPTVSRTPSFVISSTNTFGTYLGFTAGTYPSLGNIASYAVNSNTTPQGSTVNSIIARCSLVNNAVVSPTDLVDSFPINASFGSNINYTPNIEKFVKLSSGSFTSFTITLVDQNLNLINSLDKNVLITILFRFPKNK